MNRKKYKIKQKGFSLLEVLISMVIAGGLMLVVAEMNSVQQKSVGTIVSKYERTDLIQEIREILSNEQSCMATLGNQNPNNTPAGTITDIIRVRGLLDDVVNNEAADPLLSDVTAFIANADESKAQEYGNGKVKILGLSLTTDQFSTIPSEARGALHIVVDTVTSVTSYTRRVPQRIRVNVETDTAGKIVRCDVGLLGLSLYSMCSTLGGQFDPSGRGGLGNCFGLKLTGGLHVEGDLNIYHNAGEGGELDALSSVNMFSSFFENAGDGITAKMFCDTLGGKFNTGSAKCEQMQIQGDLTIGGGLKVEGDIDFFDGVPTAHPPAASSSIGITAKEICSTLGGVYNPIGRDGYGDCPNIRTKTSLSLSGDVETNLLMNVE